MKNNKTYNPPKIKTFKSFTNEQALAFLVGFIDGDGSINKNGSIIKMENHASWCFVHRFFLRSIKKWFGDCRRKQGINKRGYSVSYLSDKTVTQKLKNEVLKLGLPAMERKWNRICLTTLS